ncbi:MAG TPA: hypothetical protein VGH72_30880 [Pseudonocardia sp.]|jgi:hypothetical protein
MTRFTIGIAAVGALLGLLFNSGTDIPSPTGSLTSVTASVAAAPVR